MAVIQNKIATRTWSKNEYGDAAEQLCDLVVGGNSAIMFDNL